jgi:hypothetical protein
MDNLKSMNSEYSNNKQYENEYSFKLKEEELNIK